MQVHSRPKTKILYEINVNHLINGSYFKRVKFWPGNHESVDEAVMIHGPDKIRIIMPVRTLAFLSLDS